MFKKALSILFLSYSFVASAMNVSELTPGTVINPISHSGQFTVSIPETSLATIKSGMPSLSQVTQASEDLFKSKGTPVIITSVASMAPWWALTTGTGYLIISQCGISDPALLATLAAGASYAAGEQTNSLLKKCITNPYFKQASQLALCATCFGLSYAGGSPALNSALIAAAQSIGLQTLLETSARLLTQNKSLNNPQSKSWITETKDWIVDGTISAIPTIFPSLCATNICDPNILLRILLYEQAYRLAQSGCIVAQHFASK